MAARLALSPRPGDSRGGSSARCGGTSGKTFGRFHQAGGAVRAAGLQPLRGHGVRLHPAGRSPTRSCTRSARLRAGVMSTCTPPCCELSQEKARTGIGTGEGQGRDRGVPRREGESSFSRRDDPRHPPFADPEPDPVRRLRGRLGGRVVLVTPATSSAAPASRSPAHGRRGEPARVLVLVDPGQRPRREGRTSGRAVVQLLGWGHRDLARAFAGIAPARVARSAPSFEGTRQSSPARRRHDLGGHALESATEVGWSRLLTLVIDDVVVGADDRAARAPARPLGPASDLGSPSWPSCPGTR